MKTKKEVKADVKFWMDEIKKMKEVGRQFITTRWLKKHQLLGKVQKEAKHSVDISEYAVRQAIMNCEDWHIV